MNDRTFVVVGSLTRDAPYFQGARGKGITVFAFDAQTGQLTRLAEKGGVDNPTYLSVHEGNRCVYANSEVFGWNEGTVSAYRLDPTTGGLTYLNKQPALGSILAHNSLDRSGRFVLVANYSIYAEPEDSLPDQAVVVMPIRQDGALGPPSAAIPIRAAAPTPTDRSGRMPIASSRVLTIVTFSSPILGSTSLSSIVSTQRPARFRRSRRHRSA